MNPPRYLNVKLGLMAAAIGLGLIAALFVWNSPDPAVAQAAGNDAEKKDQANG